MHNLVAKSCDKLKGFNPDIIVAIGGGGFIPSRIVRTFLRVPMLSVSVKLYDDALAGQAGDGIMENIQVNQWFSDDATKIFKDKRVLVVDEVDDTRTTLAYVANKMLEYEPSEVGTFVLHNKLKEKRANLSDGIKSFVGMDIPDVLVNYPWESQDIDEHNQLAQNNDKVLGNNVNVSA
jgi:hypoxanthine phosphoribosyltransferase